MRPSLVLITSDFSSLPDVKVPGVRAPIVASKVAFSPPFFPRCLSVVYIIDSPGESQNFVSATCHVVIG